MIATNRVQFQKKLVRILQYLLQRLSKGHWPNQFKFIIKIKNLKNQIHKQGQSIKWTGRKKCKDTHDIQVKTMGIDLHYKSEGKNSKTHRRNEPQWIPLCTQNHIQTLRLQISLETKKIGIHCIELHYYVVYRSQISIEKKYKHTKIHQNQCEHCKKKRNKRETSPRKQPIQGPLVEIQKFILFLIFEEKSEIMESKNHTITL